MITVTSLMMRKAGKWAAIQEVLGVVPLKDNLFATSRLRTRIKLRQNNKI